MMRNVLRRSRIAAIRVTTHPLRAIALCCVISLAVGFFGPASIRATAQDLPTDQWDRTATAAETALRAGSPSEELLDRLRRQLVEQRSEALLAEEEFGARVNQLTSQVEALGPPPEEGEEPAEISERREALTAELEEARVPFVSAQAAIVRADNLIGDIDGLLRGRFSQRLTTLGPSPLNPVHWGTAFSDIADLTGDVGREIDTIAASDPRRETFLARFPFAALLVVLAITIFVNARGVLVRFRELRDDAETESGVIGWSIVLVGLRLLIPGLAAVAFYYALVQINPGLRMGSAIVSVAGPILVTIVLSNWLAGSLYAPGGSTRAPLSLEPPQAKAAGRLTWLLGLVLAGLYAATAAVEAGNMRSGTEAVIKFPLILVGGILLFPLARLIRPSRTPEDPESQETRPFSTAELITNVYARAGTVLAVVAPLLAAAGYLAAAEYAFAPFLLTGAVIGGLMQLYWLIREGTAAWVEAEGKEDTLWSSLHLIVVLLGLGLAVAAIPVLALIWGARWTDIEGVWSLFRDGVSIGETRLSAADVVTFAVVFAIGYGLTRTVQAIMRNSVLPSARVDVGARNAIVSGIGYAGIVLTAVIAISMTGLSLSNLAIVAGALSVGVGFGLQTVVSNFVSGIILLVERPIKEGDWIEVSGYSGYVRKISVRSTEIETFDRASVIVPNADLISGAVLNWTHSNVQGRVIVPVGVAYGTDLKEVETILREIAEEHPMVLRRPAPSIIFQGFGADSLDFEIRAILRDVNYVLSARSEMNYEIARRFEEAGIEIPFAQRDVTIRNADALGTALRGKDTSV